MGDLLGGDFVLKGPNPFLKIYQVVMCRYHMVESRSLNGPLDVYSANVVTTVSIFGKQRCRRLGRILFANTLWPPSLLLPTL